MNTSETRDTHAAIGFFGEVMEDCAYSHPDIALCCHVAREALAESLGKPVKKTKTFCKRNLKATIELLELLLRPVLIATGESGRKCEYAELALSAVRRKLAFRSNQKVEDADEKETVSMGEMIEWTE